MAFTSDLTLNDGTNNTVLSEISRQGNETLRRVSARGLVYPKTMRISHQQSKIAGSGKVNRCVVRIDDIQSISATDPAMKATEAIYLVIQKPEVLPVQANIQKMVVELKGFLTAENVTKLLNGES